MSNKNLSGIADDIHISFEEIMRIKGKLKEIMSDIDTLVDGIGYVGDDVQKHCYDVAKEAGE